MVYAMYNPGAHNSHLYLEAQLDVGMSCPLLHPIQYSPSPLSLVKNTPIAITSTFTNTDYEREHVAPEQVERSFVDAYRSFSSPLQQSSYGSFCSPPQPSYEDLIENPSRGSSFDYQLLENENLGAEVATKIYGNVSFYPPPQQQQRQQPESLERSHGPTRNHRSKPYSPPAPQISSVPYEFPISLLALYRLTAQETCMIKDCGETFTSCEAFGDHVRYVHKILRAKNGGARKNGRENGDEEGDEDVCQWTNCGMKKTKSSMFYHMMGHVNMKFGCAMCDTIILPRSDLVQKHYRQFHEGTHPDVCIPSKIVSKYAYCFFQE